MAEQVVFKIGDEIRAMVAAEIRRQHEAAMTEALNEMLHVLAEIRDELKMRKALEELPSAQPECEDAVSREAVVKMLHDYFDSMLETDSVCPDDLYHEAFNLPSVTPKQPGWIPVTERLPEEDTEVLVTVYFMGLKQTSPSGWNDHIKPNYYVDVASRIGDDWSSASDEYKVARHRHKVVAWMEKPKPWEGGQDEQN